jgi:hypothetical protein
LRWRQSVYSFEIFGEVALISHPDLIHYFLDTQQAIFQERFGLLHSDCLEITGGRAARFGFEEMAEMPDREMHSRRHFIQRQSALEILFHEGHSFLHSGVNGPQQARRAYFRLVSLIRNHLCHFKLSRCVSLVNACFIVATQLKLTRYRVQPLSIGQSCYKQALLVISSFSLRRDPAIRFFQQIVGVCLLQGRKKAALAEHSQ